MDWIFKKMGPAAAVSLVAFTGVLNAADDAQVRNLENRVNALEQQRKNGNGGMINPPARPVVTDGADVFISGEFLWMKACQDDMVYAVCLDHAPATPTANLINSGKTERWRGKWGPGFRIGLGYNTPHDGWDLDLKWMRYYSTHSKDNHTERGDCGCDCAPCPVCPGFFNPVFFPKDYRESATGVFPYVTEITSNRWKLRINELTLQLGREFFVSKWMTIRPYAGIKAAWVRQRARVTYSGGPYVTPLNAAGIVLGLGGADALRISNKNNWWGVGLQGGLDGQWGLGYGLSIYSRANLAILWGRHRVHQTHNLENTAVSLDDCTPTQMQKWKNKFCSFKPIAEVALGLRYDTTFSDNAWGFGIWAGWEHHYYWSQNKMFKFVGRNYDILDEYDGDLGLGGLDIGLSFDF
jgi:hypothetical protein